ncbi:hypothetical protein GCM10023080_070150 [Streptomyces pseudoechinosporeus]
MPGEPSPENQPYVNNPKKKEVFLMAVLDLQGLEIAGRREAEAAASSVSVSCS